jgi:hypothetical protein
MDAIGTTRTTVPEELAAVFANDAPGWTRLEPQSVSGDPTPGIEARVHDAAWLLARQWQLGEFQGEDVGTPVSVSVSWSSTPLDGWRPPGTVGADAGPMLPLAPGAPVEPLVESEPGSPRGLRGRFEAGAQFLAMLADAGADGAVRAAVLAACPLPEGIEAADPHDLAAGPLARLLRDRLPDGDAIARALDAAAAAGSRPPWLPAGAAGAAAAWRAWYRGVAEPDCWIEPRLEYSFDLAAGPHELTAPAFGGGRIDWYHLDRRSGPAEPTSEPGKPVTLWATPLRYPGMPADRYWALEDAEVNLGALQVAPHDLARLAIAEFALVASQDWLVIPVDIPTGALTSIAELEYTTTFGDHIPVARASDPGRFRLFEIEGMPGLLVPPPAPMPVEGAPLEEVLFLRDEVANLAWAIERVVTGPSGDPRTRADEAAPSPPPAGSGLADLAYRLETPVPAHWIPLVPVPLDSAGAIELRKGAILGENGNVLPRGVLLRGAAPVHLQDEEVPREGVQVRRVGALARRADGTYARWTTRRVAVGRGEGSSALEFDAVIPSPM